MTVYQQLSNIKDILDRNPIPYLHKFTNYVDYVWDAVENAKYPEEAIKILRTAELNIAHIDRTLKQLSVA